MNRAARYKLRLKFKDHIDPDTRRKEMSWFWRYGWAIHFRMNPLIHPDGVEPYWLLSRGEE